VHSGAASLLTVTRRAQDASDNRGLRFFWPGFDGPVDGTTLAGLRRSARRATVLENDTGGTMRTPEHLLAAALFFAEAPLDVHLDAVEPPGLDGSSLPFYQLLFSAAPKGAWRAREYDSKLKWEHDGPEGSLRARPHDHFSVEYLWEDGAIRQAFELDHVSEAPERVLPARTFILYRDWKKFSREPDLLAGAGADSGLLIASTPEEFAEALKNLPESRGTAFPLVHPEAFRLENEPARHKVLDLLGDLALNGLALPRLRLTVRNGGHALNHLLLNQLQQERLQ
jgi:UDP-3-O-acyl-N-acetylglucosamine deacetylase